MHSTQQQPGGMWIITGREDAGSFDTVDAARAWLIDHVRKQDMDPEDWAAWHGPGEMPLHDHI